MIDLSFFFMEGKSLQMRFHLKAVFFFEIVPLCELWMLCVAEIMFSFIKIPNSVALCHK